MDVGKFAANGAPKASSGRLSSAAVRGSWTYAAIALLALGCASEPKADESAPTPKADESAPTPKAPTPPVASPPSASAPAAKAEIHASVAPIQASGRTCREQPAQDFLLRKDQIAKIGASKEERASIFAARKRSVDYRTQQYGHVSGFGSRRDNKFPPYHYAKRTKFMGVPVVVHEKIIPALECVEAALRRDCTEHPYQPKSVGGIRVDNTFKDYEVSNHLYGIAVDIDSHLNPCCHCVGHWPDADACKRKVSSVYERMKMPRCWVEVFERYGFHWLGHDELEDTMHFEFLGDPDKIVE